MSRVVNGAPKHQGPLHMHGCPVPPAALPSTSDIMLKGWQMALAIASLVFAAGILYAKVDRGERDIAALGVKIERILERLPPARKDQ